MAVKLEWKDSGLCLGIWELAYTMTGSSGNARRMYVINNGHAVSDDYENEADCRQDCEAEVRRLLKDAGVEVE